jgi:hypothetical protein
MEELIDIMKEIRDQLVELNSKIDNLTSYGVYSLSDIPDGISEITNAIEGIKGEIGYDLTDIYNSLSNIEMSTN